MVTQPETPNKEDGTMAYDPEKEKIQKEETVELADDTKATAKIYTYGEGKPKFKILFSFKSRNREVFTSKFPPITDPKDIGKLRKLLQGFEKETF